MLLTVVCKHSVQKFLQKNFRTWLRLFASMSGGPKRAAGSALVYLDNRGPMSALPPKAAKEQMCLYVRFVPKGDIHRPCNTTTDALMFLVANG
jgi:hypothetical protein